MLPLKAVPSGLLRFPLPADGLTLRVNGGGVFRQTTEDGKKTALIPVDAGGNVIVSWSPRQTHETADGIVMAVRHRELAVEGVQFHPESILTEAGHRLVGNFLNLANA